MKPIEFVVFDGDSTPNMPAYEVAEAMTKDIRILSASKEYVVLSYYITDGKFFLEIEEK